MTDGYTIDMQGAELEFQQIAKNNPRTKFVGEFRAGSLSEVHHSYHIDDGKMEVSSDACKDLGELAEHLRKICGDGLKVMSQTYHPVTIGCTPFYVDFASGHIHTSVEGMNDSTWEDLKVQLYSAQPLIALLSQNSPLVGPVRAADVRLLLSNWSTFTDLGRNEKSHWLAIAYGMRGQTIEVRIPSSGPLFQIIAIAALLRVILEDNATSIALPMAKNNWSRVNAYGSSSICEIAVPSSIMRYDGFKHNKLNIRTTDLWKWFYNNYAEQFDNVLHSLSKSLRNDVEKFYKFVADGHTLSDSYYEIINGYMKRGKEDEIASKLVEISINSYTGGGAFDILPINPSPFMPVIEKYYSIEEVDKLCSKIAESNTTYNFDSVSNDVLDVFLNSHQSPTSHSISNIVVTNLFQGNPVVVRSVSTEQLRSLVNSRIVDVEHGYIIKGKNFPLAVALCKEAGLF